jgi:hypothetical protein
MNKNTLAFKIRMRKNMWFIMFVMLGSLVQQSLNPKEYVPFGEIKKNNKNSMLNMHLLPDYNWKLKFQ